jgi:hypothetical protein
VDEFPLPSPIDGDIEVRCDGGTFLLDAPLEDGRIEKIEISASALKC